jgi:F0F1-type ATP synthase membrane subunit c/vacuolar-type H+-ATPase subunit K
MAGIIGIYGLVVSVLISNDLKQESSLFTNFIQLGAGLSVGLAGMAAGFAIGIVGDAGVRGTAQQPRLFSFSLKSWVRLGHYDKMRRALTWIRSLRSHCRPTHELQG